MKIAISDVINLVKGKAIVLTQQDAFIENGYCGDFLSHVISKIPENAVWFTIMNNANVAAVAQLADVIAVIICEGVKADERLIECCKDEDIILIESPLTSFECALKLGGYNNNNESFL